MISPTGLGIRDTDKWGSGAFGAGRGKRKHQGADFMCQPCQNVWFPFESGYIVRVTMPYVNDSEFFGCQLIGQDNLNHYTAKMFYMLPDMNLIINEVRLKRGAVIGTAQNIALKYPGMIPHIHLQISDAYHQTKWFNPLNILEVPDEH